MNESRREDAVAHRFFLVGCARSGTTLLQSLLAAHPEVISFPESHFFRHLSPDAGWRKYLGIANPAIRSHLEDFYDEIEREDDACVTPLVFTLWIRSWAKAFVRSLDNKAIARGASCWLEKTPMHLHHVSLIERYVPDAQFIHLVRDGRDVVASMHEVTHRHPEVWGGARSVEECLNRWTGDIERTRHHAEKRCHHVVGYRDLTTNPEATLRRLCSTLDISYSESMIDEYQVRGKEVSRGAGEWKRPAKSVQYKGREKFDRLFDQNQKERIEATIGKYDLDTLTTI